MIFKERGGMQTYVRKEKHRKMTAVSRTVHLRMITRF